MNVFGQIIFYVGLLGIIASMTFLIIRVRKLAKTNMLETFDLKKEFRLIGILCGLFAASMVLFFSGAPFTWTDSAFFIWNGHWDVDSHSAVMGTGMTGAEWACLIIGALIVGLVIPVTYASFRIHYYQKELPKKLDKWLYRIVLLSLPVFVIGIWVLTEGMANHVFYPLVNGISWTNGFKFVTAANGNTNIAWYAVCILSGALYVYFICDHLMYKEFGKHGLLESTLYVAFPGGIIGARIAYVIGNWSTEFATRVANGEWWCVFAVWEGGITILGGAIGGILVGVLWFTWRHRDINIFKTIDIVVPTILVAQAVGRWGNFFNCEVHGEAVSSAYWEWLPKFIYNQSHYSASAGWSGSGTLFAPLFLVEAIVNMAGFFVMAFLFGRLLKSLTRPGDMFGGYMIWYGFTRVFMEPLRYGAYNMGADGAWSWIWANFFVTIGILFIVVNHVVRLILLYRKEDSGSPGPLAAKRSWISIPVIVLVAAAILAVGISLYVSNPAPTEGSLIALVPHNIGFIMLTFGASLFLTLGIPVSYLVVERRKTAIHA